VLVCGCVCVATVKLSDFHFGPSNRKMGQTIQHGIRTMVGVPTQSFNFIKGEEKSALDLTGLEPTDYDKNTMT